MKILSNDNKEIEPLNDADLVYMGKRLKNIVNLFLNDILLHNEDCYEKLRILNSISDALINRNYSILINDTSLIDYDETHSDTNDIDEKIAMYMIKNEL